MKRVSLPETVHRSTRRIFVASARRRRNRRRRRRRSGSRSEHNNEANARRRNYPKQIQRPGHLHRPCRRSTRLASLSPRWYCPSTTVSTRASSCPWKRSSTSASPPSSLHLAGPSVPHPSISIRRSRYPTLVLACINRAEKGNVFVYQPGPVRGPTGYKTFFDTKCLYIFSHTRAVAMNITHLPNG